MIIVRCRIVVTLAGALLLAACGDGVSHVRSVPPPPAVRTASATDAAFNLMLQGDEGTARKRLKGVLKRDPMNIDARLLSDSIDRDPKDLLGPKSFGYTVHTGDTIIGLAQRFLGNRLMAYQLARYNGLKAPVTLVAGQRLQIPGEPPRPEPARIEPPRPAPAGQKPKPAPAKPSAVHTDPSAGRQARAAGLTALNEGNVSRAVGLLRRATALDPGNALIARDLARAERIAATVKARR